MSQRIYFPIAFLAFIQGGTSLLSLYLNESGIDAQSMSLILPALGIGGLIGGVLGGILSEKYNTKKLLILMSIALILVPFILSTNKITLKFVSVFMIGFSLACCRSVVLFIITSYEDKLKVERSLSIRRLILNLCFALGSGLVGFLLSKSNDYYNLYILFFGLASFASILYYKVEHSEPIIAKQEDTKRKRSKSLYLLSVISLLLSLMCCALIPTYYTLYIVNEKSFPVEVAGYVFTFSGFLVVTFQIKVSEIVKNIDIHYRVIIGSLLISLGTYCIQFINGYIGLVISVFIWTFGEIILYVPAIQLILKYSTNNKGKTISIYQSLFSISDFIIPVIGGMIILIGFSYIWDLSLILGILSSFIIFLLKTTNGVDNENYKHQYSSKT